MQMFVERVNPTCKMVGANHPMGWSSVDDHLGAHVFQEVIWVKSWPLLELHASQVFLVSSPRAPESLPQLVAAVVGGTVRHFGRECVE